MDQERNAHACLLSCTHSRRTACPCLLATSNRKQHLKDTRWPSHFGHRSNKERPLLLAAASSGQWDWIHCDRCASGGGVGPRSSEGCCRSSSFCITNRPSGVSLHARPAIEPKWLHRVADITLHCHFIRAPKKCVELLTFPSPAQIKSEAIIQ
jgi:hypothetical protein